MEVKAGYKQTEVGVIPEEWDVKPLAANVQQHNSGIYKKSAQYGKGFNIVGVSDIYDINCVDGQRFAEVPLTEKEQAKYSLKENDLLYGESSLVREGIARTVYVTDRGAGTAFAWHTRRYSVNQSALSSAYLYYYLQSRIARMHMMNQCIQTALTGINTAAYFACPLLLPALPEQRAIAGALNDVDALLGGLDRLIAKKRDLKQAAMQQLLTGQTRLPGFHGEGELRPLEEITDCLDNVRVPLNEAQREKMQGDYPYCGANGVLGFVDDYLIDDDIILMAEDGGYFDEYETRPIAYRMVGKCWVNNHAHILKAKSGFDQGFIFYSLVHKNILPFLASGTRAKLNKSEMNKIELKLPPTLAEQAEIAEVLTEIDAELTALEQRREKTRALKQAMMQELLTGRTRLVSPKEAHA